MAVSIRTYPLWCLGLEADDEACVRACAGHDYVVERLAFDALPELAGELSGEGARNDVPALLWLGSESWLRLLADPEWGRSWERLPRVLILPADCPREDLLKALSGGFQNVICGPLTPERAHEALRRSLEQSNLCRDMDRMAREILLNRELLMRKSDVLAFLLRFVRDVVPDACGLGAYGPQLASAAAGGREQAFSIFALLREVRSCLEELLPVRAVHAAFCRGAGDGSRLAELRIDAREGSSLGKDWAELLVSALNTIEGAVPDARARAAGPQEPISSKAPERADRGEGPAGTWRVATRTQRLLPADDGVRSTSGDFPTSGLSPERILLLPLAFPSLAHATAGTAFDSGVLAIELERECQLGRDQALALDAAMNHLVWVLSRTPSELPEKAFIPFDLATASHLAVNQ